MMNQHWGLIESREEQFVDDAEMAEIRSNERLMARLREGSRQGKERRGRFVQ